MIVELDSKVVISVLNRVLDALYDESNDKTTSTTEELEKVRKKVHNNEELNKVDYLYILNACLAVRNIMEKRAKENTLVAEKMQEYCDKINAFISQKIDD